MEGKAGCCLSGCLPMRSGRESMVIIAVEAVPAGSKPPAAVSVRISTGKRQSFGVRFYVCLHGETWLPSFMLKAC